MIETFPPNRSDDSLGVSILPWRPRSGDSRCGACTIDPVLIVPGINAPNDQSAIRISEPGNCSGKCSAVFSVLQVRVLHELEVQMKVFLATLIDEVFYVLARQRTELVF
jgi:hypothetical protein